MKSAKVIIPIIAVLFVSALAFLFWKMTDHREEFSAALYSGNLTEVETLLKKHPSLANARHMEKHLNPGNSPVDAGNWSQFATFMP